MTKKIRLTAFLYIAFCLNTYAQVRFYKVIRLHHDEMSLIVPTNWKIKGQALKFAVYEIKYSVEVQDKIDKEGVSLYIYGQQYGPKMQVNESIVQDKIQGLLGDPVRKIEIEKSGIKMISALGVGFIKYTYRVKIKSIFTRSYAIEVFFCNKKNIYYEMEIISLNKSVADFKPIAEKVFESLSIHD